MSREARLHARPGKAGGAGPVGQQRLAFGNPRDSYFYVPQRYDAAQPTPLVLLLHGAGGHAHHGLDLLEHLADDHNLLLVAPASTAPTWDVIAARTYGPDVLLTDQALDHVFRRYAVDSARLAIGGFSDGASYALSLGLANGDLFSHVIAFSPGFIAQLTPVGQPQIFVSHGTRDNVLPIDPCSRHVVSRLKRAEYDVTYREFDGGHAIPGDIARDAVDWFLK